MIKCVNQHCNNNPFDDELKMVLATPDADFACSKECLEKFKAQREDFFNNISNDSWYKNWMGF